MARLNRSDLSESEIDGIVFHSEAELSKFDGIRQSDKEERIALRNDEDAEVEEADESSQNTSSRESSVYSRSSMNIDSLFLRTYANDMGSVE